MANLHMSKECSIFASSFKESTFLGKVETFLGMSVTALGSPILTKSHFGEAGSSAVVLSVFSRSSVGGARERIREVNLKNSIVFC